ncbi:MAG: flagellar basal-body MS-ring/collar protein FliF [Asticcacaulis sp.]|uniref:flagellar basal-body MS-ring/collar protein FliF n=1 Tax=Asticcacaulis sp. TaxID=1872648 RepID=UPI0039E44C14
MESFFAGLQKFGIGRLTAILGAAAGAAAVLAAIILHVSAQPQALLYSNLDLKEAGEITQNLDQAGIKYTAKGDGSTIMVDRDKVATARMMLAGKGLPTAASVGYEIFDNAPTLGQTEFVQNLDNQRALEGELSRTINTLKGVSSTRVHLVMPKRELFSDSPEQAKATVVLGLSGSNPNAEQVDSIRNLVASAVPNLKPADVTIVDDRNHLLAAGGDDSANGLGAAHRDEVEDKLRKRITDIVEGVVGPGAARVTVTADLDQTAVTQEKVDYNPDGQVVRSTATTESKDSTSDPNSNGAVTASANIPGGAQQPGTSTATQQSGQTTETTNYEISTTKTTSVTAPGEIKKLAVAVVVDGTLTPSKDGKAPPAYAARSPEDMQKIEDLVRAAVGIDANRGDVIKVTNIRFSHGDIDTNGGTGGKASMFDFDKNDIMRAAEVAVLFIVALLTLFLVARPLLKYITSSPTNILVTGPGGVALAGAGAGITPGLGGPSDSGLAQLSNGAGALSPSVTDSAGIDIARIEGQVRASSVKKVSEFVDRHPEESVSILRSWLHEG